MKVLPVPDSELQLIIGLIKNNPKYFDINDLSKSYKKSSKKLINNPFSKDIVKYIVKYLKKKKTNVSNKIG